MKLSTTLIVVKIKHLEKLSLNDLSEFAAPPLYFLAIFFYAGVFYETCQSVRLL